MVQGFLRHEHLSTTDLYIGNIHSDLGAAMEQISSGYDLNAFPAKSPLNEKEAKLLSLTS